MNYENYRRAVMELLRKEERTPLEQLEVEDVIIDFLIAMGGEENEVLHFLASVEEQLVS